MATKVTKDMIIQMNELYLELKTYAAVAREVGVSASTVSKYIQPGYVSLKNMELKHFRITDLPTFNYEVFRINNWSDLCCLSDEEVEEIHELWKEMSI